MNANTLATVALTLTAARDLLSQLCPELDGAALAAIQEAGVAEQTADAIVQNLPALPALAGLDGVAELDAARRAGLIAAAGLNTYSATLDDLGTRVQAFSVALGNTLQSLTEAPTPGPLPETEEDEDDGWRQDAPAETVPAAHAPAVAAPADLPSGVDAALDQCRALGEPGAGQADLPEDEDGTEYEAPLHAEAAHANPPAEPAPEPVLAPEPKKAKKARKRR